MEEIQAFCLTLKSTRSAVASTMSERRHVWAGVAAGLVSSSSVIMPPSVCGALLGVSV
jgi:hypothetical protein